MDRLVEYDTRWMREAGWEKVHELLKSALRDLYLSFSWFSGGSHSKDAKARASSLSTGVAWRYVMTLGDLGKGQWTCFHVMNSVTCLANCQNFSKLM